MIWSLAEDKKRGGAFCTVLSRKGWAHGFEGCRVPEHGPGAASSPVTQVGCSKKGNTSLSNPCTLFCNVCFKQRARRTNSSREGFSLFPELN